VLVWFLWFLFWLLPGFVVYAKAANHWRWRFSPHPLLSSQASLVWLVPLTILPTAWMGAGHGHFGPDTSMGILPLPHVLAYYALFFGFGVLYFESNDAAGRLGRAWRWTLPVSVLAVFPLGLEFAAGPFGVRETLLPAPWHRPVAVALQALYAWMMCFAGIGLFRSLMVRESKNIRYLSDASFWFYLAHLPVVLLVQAGISTWIFPAILKFFATCLIVSFAMLWSYEKTVRNTVVGRFLRGACTCFDRQKTASNRTSLYS
jgi:hypothetical protein